MIHYSEMQLLSIELGQKHAEAYPLLKSRAKGNLCNDFGKYWALAHAAKLWYIAYTAEQGMPFPEGILADNKALVRHLAENGGLQ